jgi:hypothetical protein
MISRNRTTAPNGNKLGSVLSRLRGNWGTRCG